MDNISADKKVEILKSILLNFNRKNDTEKMASLLAVPKLISSSEISESELQDVFSEVGFNFVNRLLRIKNVPEDCSTHTFQGISLVILKSFSYLQALAEDESMLKNIAIFCEILTEAVDMKTLDEDEMKTLISDCFEIMINISKTSKGCERLIRDDIIFTLRDYIVNFHFGWENAFDIIKSMVKHDSFPLSKNCHLEFPTLMTTVAEKIFTPRSEAFEVLKHLAGVLDCCDKKLLSVIDLDSFWQVLIDGLYGMLISKVNLERRQMAINASCKLISLLGVDFFMGQERHEKFFFLAFHLSSLELQLSLEETSAQEDPVRLQLYASCCEAFESSIQLCGSTTAGDRKAERLREMVFDLMTSIVHYFGKFSGNIDEEDVTPYCQMLLRLVCSFVNFEEFALDEDVLSFLPAILNVYSALFKTALERMAMRLHGTGGCKCQFQTLSERMELVRAAVSRTSVVDGAEPEIVEAVADPPKEHDLQLLDLFLPGLESLTHLKEAREVVLDSDWLEILLHYFSVLCHREAEGRAFSLDLLCNIFCNFVYPDEELCQESCFQEVCVVLLHVLTGRNCESALGGAGDAVSDTLLSLQTVCIVLLRKTGLLEELDGECLEAFRRSAKVTLKRAMESSSTCDPDCVQLLRAEADKLLQRGPCY